MLGELAVSELDSRLLVRARGVGLGKGHRHVEVGAAGLEGGSEDLRVEARVGRVHDHVRTLLAGCGGDGGLIGRVEPNRREPVGLAERADGALGARVVDVGDRHVLEEGPPLRDCRDRGSNAPSTDDESPHRCRGSPIRLTEFKLEGAHSASRCASRLTECGESGTNRLGLRRIEAQRQSSPRRRGPVRGARRIDALDQGIIEALQAQRP